MARFSADLRSLALAAALAAAGGCAAPPAGPLLLHPLPPVAEGYVLDRGGTRFDGPGFTATARPVDWKFVGQCYAGAGEPLPFGSEESLSGLVFISLRLDNRSAQTLFFTPLNASLFAGGKTPILPLEVSDVYRLAAGSPGGEERTRSFLRTSYSGSEEVRPGASVETYLVFLAPKEKTPTVRLVLDDLYLGGDSHDLTFLFEAFPGSAE